MSANQAAIPTSRSQPANNIWANIRRYRWTEFRLLLIPSILSIIGMLMVILVPTGAVQWQWTDLWMSFLFIGLIYGCHLWFNFASPNADQVLLPIVATLTVLGLVMIQRLEPSLSAAFRGIANKQVVWITAGMIALWSMVALLRDLNWLRRYKYTFALGGIILVGATLIFGSDAGNGTGVRLWFNFGFFQFQPSELLKVLLVIFLAGYLDDKRELLARAGASARSAFPLCLIWHPCSCSGHSPSSYSLCSATSAAPYSSSVSSYLYSMSPAASLFM